MRKIIFLDIDGVLNHVMYFKSRSDLCNNIDTEMIKLLNELIDNTGAEIVISSTWRKGRTVDELKHLLESNGLCDSVIDFTPELRYSKGSYTRVPRGAEIHEWIKLHIGYDYDSMLRYVIFDDDSDMLYIQKNNFIHVDRYCGLTPTIIQKAERILNNI